MRQVAQKWLSSFIIFTLIVTLFPIMNLGSVATAATNPIVITNPMGTKENPTQVTDSMIDIQGSFYGVTNLSYTLTQYRKKPGSSELERIKSREGVERALVVDSNFNFQSIQLFEGINEIYVHGLQNGQVVGDRKYVEVTNLPVITSIFYNTQDLWMNNRISSTLFNDELVIKGTILNADTIVAKVNGSTTEYPGSVLNNGTYVIAKIPLQRGKNTVELIARNITKTYPSQLEIIYDDGQPFVSGKLLNAPSDHRDLKNPMTFSTGDILIEGQIHNFQSAPSDDTLEITFNGHSFSITRSAFDQMLAATSPNPLFGTNPDGVNYSFRALDNTGKFRVNFSPAKQNSNNYLTYKIQRGARVYVQSYTLEHLDETQKYIVNVSGLGSTVTSKTISFYVTTNDNVTASDWVKHEYIDGTGTRQQPTGSLSGPLAGVTAPTYLYEVDLVPGTNIITISPNGTTVNAREFRVMYVNSPDVKILNLVNGDRLGGDSGLPPQLLAELINVTATNLEDKVNITIENTSGRNTYTLSSSNFGIDSVASRFLFDLTGKLQAGSNDIIVTVTEGATTTTTRITVFYFATNSPSVAIELHKDNMNLIFPEYNFKTLSPNQYETDGRFVHIKATYGTADNVEEVFLYYNGVRVAHINSAHTLIAMTGWDGYFDQPNPENSSDPSTAYNIETLYPFTLEDGQNTFEIEAFSKDGLSRSDKLYITRVNPPIRIVKPDLDREKVVNSNYIEVVIDAASADKVKIGKVDAQYQKLNADELRSYIQLLPPHVMREILLDYGMWDILSNDFTPDYFLDEKVERIDQSRVANKRFVADVILKPGKNKITYEIEQNGTKIKNDFEIFYAASPTEGAMFKQDFKSGKISVFDKKLNLEFPKNTWLVDKITAEEIFDEFQSDASLKFGIVDRATGKLNKVWDPVLEEYVLAEFEEPYRTLMPVMFLPPDRTGYAGQIYWIESAGDIKYLDSGFLPTNRALLSIAYDSSIRDDSQNQLAIYHFDPVKEKWVNIGGVVNTKAKTVSAYIYEFGYYTVMAKRGTFNDIFSHEWAGNFLAAMFSKGIMMPETHNRFGSDMLTTRGEFATILVKALEIPINAGPYLNGDKNYPMSPTFVDVNPFLDPPNEFYSYEYIETAGRAGIIRGMGQGEFGPDGLLTREQAAMMIARAANFKITSDIEKVRKSLAKTYADIDRMSDYALPYVEATLKAGVMNGAPIENSKMMSFNPTQYLTRAEAAAIAYRLMQNQKKLPK